MNFSFDLTISSISDTSFTTTGSQFLMIPLRINAQQSFSFFANGILQKLRFRSHLRAILIQRPDSVRPFCRDALLNTAGGSYTWGPVIPCAASVQLIQSTPYFVRDMSILGHISVTGYYCRHEMLTFKKLSSGPEANLAIMSGHLHISIIHHIVGDGITTY
jgi:hypothetical protein